MIATIDNLDLATRAGTSTKLEELIGNTPLLQIDATTAAAHLLGRRLSAGIRLLAKAEWYNPGGSIKDPEVIAACDEYNMAMVLTGERHFRH